VSELNKSLSSKLSGTGKRAMLIALVQLALPAILQQLLSSVLQYVDTAMVGHLGEAATAAVSTSTSVNWLVHSLPYGFTIGILSLISRAYGRGDGVEMKRLAAMGCRVVIFFGAILTAACLAISPFLPISAFVFGLMPPPQGWGIETGAKG
jgi:Na+-driven multidrug efflux pump